MKKKLLIVLTVLSSTTSFAADTCGTEGSGKRKWCKSLIATGAAAASGIYGLNNFDKANQFALTEEKFIWDNHPNLEPVKFTVEDNSTTTIRYLPNSEFRLRREFENLEQEFSTVSHSLENAKQLQQNNGIALDDTIAALEKRLDELETKWQNLTNKAKKASKAIEFTGKDVDIQAEMRKLTDNGHQVIRVSTIGTPSAKSIKKLLRKGRAGLIGYTLSLSFMVKEILDYKVGSKMLHREVVDATPAQSEAGQR